MEITLPSLGEGVESGVVSSILVSKGDNVKKDQSLLELESDKAVAEMPSPESGKITDIRISEGDEVSVGDVLMILEADDEDADSGSDGSESEDSDAGEEDASDAKESKDDAQDEDGDAASQKREKRERKQDSGDKELSEPAAPSVRRVARDAGIDLSKVSGSGRGGRILLEDLRAYVKGLETLAREARRPVDPTAGLPDLPDFSEFGKVERVGAGRVRKAIARHVSASWPAVPQVTQFAEFDISSAMEAKEQVQDDFEKDDLSLTLTVILLKALVPVLKEFRRFNASYDSQNDELILKRYLNIGVAADTDEGLVVPVMRDVDNMSLREMAAALGELAEKARAGKLTGADMAGGSFTLSNQGGLGGHAFTPLVRYPETAILGVGRARIQPVWINEEWKPRQIMPVGLSYDHRIIDGGDAARFVEALRHELSEINTEWMQE